MDITIHIFILLIFAGLLYALYLNALLRIEVKHRQLKRGFSRRISRTNQSINDLKQTIENLKPTDDKKDAAAKNGASGAANNFDRMEDRIVREIKDNEVVMVDGKMVRKSAAFK